LKIIDFPKIHDSRGNLSFIEFPSHVPFEIKRAFWTYDVPGGETRGGHAYFKQEEIIIALSGSFDVVITHRDGAKEKLTLNRSYYGLYIPPNTWRHMENFSTNALGLHLCGSKFNEEDYIRNFDNFLEINEVN
jgi:dTDP-4-dehydrorhamnose 3,5-epimerase-like enzyme